MDNEFSKYFVIMSYYVAPFITPFIYFVVMGSVLRKFDFALKNAISILFVNNLLTKTISSKWPKVRKVFQF